MGMENMNIEFKGKGIKVRVLSSIFIALGVIIMISSFFVIKKIYNRYDEMMESYKDMGVDRNETIKFQKASDYLTDQSRKYVVTGDLKYLNNYFEEKDVLKNRESTLEFISDNHMLEIECDLLNDAMKQSTELVDYELHAMKLVVVSSKTDLSNVPDEISSYKLSEEEINADSNEQQRQAELLLYNKEYESLKDRINWDIENSTVLVEEELGALYRENQDDLINTLNSATLLIFIMFVLLVLIFIFTSLLVVRPADKFIDALNKREKLPEIGGYEFRKFARKYNDVYRSDKKNQELLREHGEIDGLTGALKVSSLDFIKNKLSQNNDPLGIMLVDIDNFRSIKEANGYEVADKLVAKIAKLFSTSFKSSDYFIRTSQDEFELFLIKMKESDSEMLTERIAKINQQLKEPTDDIPKASVSVGIAFSENGFNIETEREADMALNYVKENGRGDCRISKK